MGVRYFLIWTPWELEDLTLLLCVSVVFKAHFMVVKEQFESQLHSAEIEVTVRSSYFPTMKLLDLPGITSGSTDTGIDKKSSQIAGKYLKGKGKWTVLLCHSAAGEISGLGPSLKIMNEKKREHIVLVLTKVDLVGKFMERALQFNIERRV